jgi:ketosteroid isomerase-like protein
VTSRERLIELAETYFARVDGKDLDGVASLLAPDCLMTIETAGVAYEGRAAILAMFERYMARWETIWHGNFDHVVDTAEGRLACRFEVRKTAPDGGLDEKRNANFFTFEGGRIRHISVYMMGENTLR